MRGSPPHFHGTPRPLNQRQRQVSWLGVIANQPSRARSPSGVLVGDLHTVAGTAMASGSHFSPYPYSLIKAWGFAPQPPST